MIKLYGMCMYIYHEYSVNYQLGTCFSIIVSLSINTVLVVYHILYNCVLRSPLYPDVCPITLFYCISIIVSVDTALVSWPTRVWGTTGVRCAKWSPSRPCVFYVLDDNSRLYTFDLLEGDSMPAKIETLSQDAR